jgi:hypothetical protein
MFSQRQAFGLSGFLLPFWKYLRFFSLELIGPLFFFHRCMLFFPCHNCVCLVPLYMPFYTCSMQCYFILLYVDFFLFLEFHFFFVCCFARLTSV